MTAPREPFKLTLPADMPRGVGNCGVVAVALMAGVDHATALAALGIDPAVAADGRAFSRGRKAGAYSTFQHQRNRALEALGHTVEVAVHHLDRKPRHRLAWWTARLAWGRNFMLRVNRHAIVVRDGLIYDQCWEGVPIGHHFSRNQIVTDISYIVEATA